MPNDAVHSMSIGEDLEKILGLKQIKCATFRFNMMEVVSAEVEIVLDSEQTSKILELLAKYKWEFE